MATTRRDFMKQSGSALLGATGVGALGPRMLFGQPGPESSQPPTLVVFYLRGGADPLNTIVPHGDPSYYQVRPTIAIPRRSTPDRPGVIPINKMFGFHPAMKELAELYEQGMVAPIINAGSTHSTRSHFDAQDFMERAAPGIKWISEGWLNRYLSATRTADDRDLRAVSVRPTLPRSLRGEYPVLAVPHHGANKAMDVFDDLYSCDSSKEANKKMGDGAPTPGAQKTVKPAKPQTGEDTLRKIVSAGSHGIAKLRKLNSIVGGGKGFVGAAYPGGGIARQFRDVASVIKANEGLEIATVEYNGWDHHAYQGSVDGTMADMLTNVSGSIKAFVDDLGPRMQKVMILCMTEFGRTVRENGTNGSDHGHGGFMLAIGGPVRGGKVYGKWTGLDRNSLYDGRDLPVPREGDFRLVFAETLEAMFGFRALDHDFFPGYEPKARPVGFLNPIVQG